MRLLALTPPTPASLPASPEPSHRSLGIVEQFLCHQVDIVVEVLSEDGFVFCSGAFVIPEIPNDDADTDDGSEEFSAAFGSEKYCIHISITKYYFRNIPTLCRPASCSLAFFVIAVNHSILHQVKCIACGILEISHQYRRVPIFLPSSPQMR